MAIAHVDCDAFYATIKKRDRSGDASDLGHGPWPIYLQAAASLISSCDIVPDTTKSP
jgi:nucleotidyltransferase/DNA polymerase involved in DNA repair